MIKKNIGNYISNKVKSSQQKLFEKLKEKDFHRKGLDCEECGDGVLRMERHDSIIYRGLRRR